MLYLLRGESLNKEEAEIWDLLQIEDEHIRGEMIRQRCKEHRAKANNVEVVGEPVIIDVEVIVVEELDENKKLEEKTGEQKLEEKTGEQKLEEKTGEQILDGGEQILEGMEEMEEMEEYGGAPFNHAYDCRNKRDL